MINPRYVETMIATAIKDRDHYAVVPQKLVWHQDKIKCWPRHKVEPDSFFICNITEQQLREGFSIPEWQSITAKAISIIKELKT